MTPKPKLVFSDFDGTLTHGHELRPNFFSLLDQCHRLKAPLIITTGRSLSWGHFFLTHLPLKWAILEGGGVVVHAPSWDRLEEFNLVSDDELKRLEEMSKRLLSTFSGLKLSIDSFGRRSDRAIEHFASETQKKEVETFLNENGLHYSCSNVHLNFWCGEVSKFKAIEFVLEKFHSSITLDQIVFFGDSLNDQSVFEKVPHTVGVANIKKYLPQMKFHPQTVLEGPENESCDGVCNYLRSI